MKTWEQTVAEALARGGKVIAPNNLPIACVRHDDTCLEHEHADHPDYLFPVSIVYTEPVPPVPADWEGDAALWALDYETETHALIYYDDSIALTLYEACYFIWSLRDGRGFSGFGRRESPGWLLSSEDRERIAARGAVR